MEWIRDATRLDVLISVMLGDLRSRIFNPVRQAGLARTFRWISLNMSKRLEHEDEASAFDFGRGWDQCALHSLIRLA